MLARSEYPDKTYWRPIFPRCLPCSGSLSFLRKNYQKTSANRHLGIICCTPQCNFYTVPSREMFSWRNNGTEESNPPTKLAKSLLSCMFYVWWNLFCKGNIWKFKSATIIYSRVWRKKVRPGLRMWCKWTNQGPLFILHRNKNFDDSSHLY